jgi:cyclophilin family peptidyl-prolyl cis-trans isomerase
MSPQKQTLRKKKATKASESQALVSSMTSKEKESLLIALLEERGSSGKQKPSKVENQFDLPTKVAEAQFKQALETIAFDIFRTDPANAETVRNGQIMSQSGNMAGLRAIELQVQERMKPIIDKLYAEIPEIDKKRYANWGGAPNLDNNYTVFGKLVSGYHVLSAIESQPTNMQDRPTRDISIIEAKVLK